MTTVPKDRIYMDYSNASPRRYRLELSLLALLLAIIGYSLAGLLWAGFMVVLTGLVGWWWFMREDLLQRLTVSGSLAQSQEPCTLQEPRKQAYLATAVAPGPESTPKKPDQTGDGSGAATDGGQKSSCAQARAELMSVLSHELRSPLSAIKGYADLLRAGIGGELTSEQTQFLDIVLENADRSVQLLDDLRHITYLDAGKIQLAPAGIDLAQLISAVARTLTTQSQAPDQQFTVDVGDSSPLVWADEQHLSRALSSLLRYARSHTPTGGQIKICISSDPKQVTVGIQDSGSGLAADIQATLFEPHYRMFSRLSQPVEDTGLQLAIARSLIELHGGHIWVESKFGQGTTIYFTLPIFQEDLVLCNK